MLSGFYHLLEKSENVSPGHLFIQAYIMHPWLNMDSFEALKNKCNYGPNNAWKSLLFMCFFFIILASTGNGCHNDAWKGTCMTLYVI